MEKISSTLENLTGEPARRIPKENPELSTASTPQEPAKSSFRWRVRSDEAERDGWTFKTPPRKPETCKFCGATLYYYGVVAIGHGRHVLAWMQQPERCECPQAQSYWQKYDEKHREEEEARERRAEQERIQCRIAKLMRESGIRGRFQQRTFERFVIDEKNAKAFQAAAWYAEHFADMLPATDARGHVIPPAKERNGLFIVGSYGTGKTHLATAIANSLIRSGTPVICMTMIDLLARIKRTFDNGDLTEDDVMRIYEEVPLLVIDDLGSEQPTEWGIAKIYTIINARYEALMPVVITTNYTGKELIRRMTPAAPGDSRNAEKTLDRLKEMCEGVEMFWDSWRPR